MKDTPPKDTFPTGATRDANTNKPDYEGFLSPLALARFAQYMHEHRRMADGSLRDSDNWQKGIPIPRYRQSLVRHLFDAWRLWRGWRVEPQQIGGTMRTPTLEDLLCAIIFNAQGMLHEMLLREDTQRISENEFRAAHGDIWDFLVERQKQFDACQAANAAKPMHP